MKGNINMDAKNKINGAELKDVTGGTEVIAGNGTAVIPVPVRKPDTKTGDSVTGNDQAITDGGTGFIPIPY